MKAFLVGLLTLIAVVALTCLGVFLFPFLVLLGFVVRIIILAILLLFAVWLLGKFVLYIWQKIR